MSQTTHVTETAPTGATGPRTEQGKAISSQNALQYGLFAKQDFVLPGEHAEYAQTRLILMNELSPEGLLEQTFADEIMSANWRLRRCRLVEANLAIKSLEDPAFDDDQLDRKQRSIDRSRAAAHNVLRRSIAELRRLQTERRIRLELGVTESLGLADTAKILRTVDLATANNAEAEETTPAPKKRLTLSDLENLMSLADKKLCADVRGQHASSFCKTNASASSQPSQTEAPNRPNRFPKLRSSRDQAA